MIPTKLSHRTLSAWAALLAVTVIGCDVDDEPSFPPPTAADVAAHYEYAGDLSVEISGNVAQITVRIDREAYRMGGEVWARGSPFIFLFSPATAAAFEEHPGLGGVRVIVRYEDDDTMLAQALLERGALTPGRWREALQVAAQARSEGTERPGYMRDLVRWGEDYTDFEYNPEYISGS